jgi:hypothetical protein
MSLDQFAKDLFTFASAISPRRVVKIAAQRNGPVKRSIKFTRVSSGPSGKAPHTVADFTYLELCSSQSPVLHNVSR